jgi:hypothetical protein
MNNFAQRQVVEPEPLHVVDRSVILVAVTFRSWSFFDFCDAGFSRLGAVAALARRFIATMINTSSSVKPRVVIFHMTASQLIRSIASLSKARAMPNVVAQVSDRKARG